MESCVPSNASTKAAMCRRDGAELVNWMKNIRTTPAVYVEACDVTVVQEVVKDTSTYPSPVRAAGALASPSACHVNDGGTTIGMQKMNAIIGFKQVNGPGGSPVRCVEAESGVRLTDLQYYLQQHGLEMPFSAEVGISTLGGTCFTTTKDSTVGPVCPSGALGDVASCLMTITVVDPQGEVVEHKLFDEQGQENSEFQLLLDSQGTQCIAVRMCVAVRMKTPVQTKLLAVPFVTTSELAASIKSRYLEVRKDGGNVFAAISLKHGYTLMEQRLPVERPGTLNKVNVIRGLFSRLKKRDLQGCRLPRIYKLMQIINNSPLTTWTRDSQRRGYEYPKDVPESHRRLTFAYYSFDFEYFEAVVERAMMWIASYKAKTSFTPDGIAVYFVTRNGKRAAGPYAGKGAGTSFSFDPVYHDPLDAKWTAFVREFNAWVRDNGGIASLNQTPEIELEPEWGALCLSGTPHERFCNTWMMNFVRGDQSVPHSLSAKRQSELGA